MSSKIFLNFDLNSSFISIPSSHPINRYHRVRPGNSRVQQLTWGTWSLGFPSAQLVYCRHSEQTGVIISSFLLPHLVPCLLSHSSFPLTHQVVKQVAERERDAFLSSSLPFYQHFLSLCFPSHPFFLNVPFPFGFSWEYSVCCWIQRHPRTCGPNFHINPEIIMFPSLFGQPTGGQGVGHLDGICNGLAICMSCTRISKPLQSTGLTQPQQVHSI